MIARMCLDCGIPPWSDCVCDDDAGLDHPRNPYLRTTTFTPSGAHDRAYGRTAAPEGPGTAHAGADGDDPARCPARGVQPTTLAGEGRAANGERHAPSPVEHRPYGGPRP